MTWNKKNDQFALSCGLTRLSVLLMMRWILRRAKLNEVCEIEIDLRIFNAWVAKNRGRGFDRKTIREAIALIDEKSQGLILITKSYTPWVKKVLVRPLGFVLADNSPLKDKLPKLTTSKPMYSDDHKIKLIEQQQQDISKIKLMLDNIGLKYTHDAILRLWRYADKKIVNVKNAVEYMLYCHSEKIERDPHSHGIIKPRGWLNDCLKYWWHTEYIDFQEDREARLPVFDVAPNIEHRDPILKFIDGLCPS